MTKKEIIKKLKEDYKIALADMDMTTETDMVDYYEGMAEGLAMAIEIINSK